MRCGRRASAKTPSRKMGVNSAVGCSETVTQRRFLLTHMPHPCAFRRSLAANSRDSSFARVTFCEPYHSESRLNCLGFVQGGRATTMPGQIQEVYAELGRVLNRPEAFGLGSRAPRPLAHKVASTRRMFTAGSERAANAA
jgi:hypothetical protein